MKRKKTYPGGGPPLLVQAIGLGQASKDKFNTKFVRDWVKDQRQHHGRPETIEAYATI